MENDLVFIGLRHPFSLQIVGPTGVGKTKLLFGMLNERFKIIDTPIRHIYFIYGIYQDAFDRIKKVDKSITFQDKLPNVREKKTVFVFDDF